MECYACEQEATKQCRRCARVYCDLHGGELCAECLSPASALPSFNLYRGSLLALLIGTAVAVWLLVRPPGPGESGEVEVPIFNVTPTPLVTRVVETTTPTEGTSTPTPTRTPRPTNTPRPTTPEPRTYTVQQGDTLESIAAAQKPPGVDTQDYVRQIAAANNIDVDNPLIQPGDTLILP